MVCMKIPCGKSQTSDLHLPSASDRVDRRKTSLILCLLNGASVKVRYFICHTSISSIYNTLDGSSRSFRVNLCCIATFPITKIIYDGRDGDSSRHLNGVKREIANINSLLSIPLQNNKVELLDTWTVILYIRASNNTFLPAYRVLPPHDRVFLQVISSSFYKRFLGLVAELSLDTDKNILILNRCISFLIHHFNLTILKEDV